MVRLNVGVFIPLEQMLMILEFVDENFLTFLNIVCGNFYVSDKYVF